MDSGSVMLGGGKVYSIEREDTFTCSMCVMKKLVEDEADPYREDRPRTIETGIMCPNDDGGMVVRRVTKDGRAFYGCSEFPYDKWASWDIPVPSLPYIGKYPRPTVEKQPIRPLERSTAKKRTDTYELIGERLGQAFAVVWVLAIVVYFVWIVTT